MGDALDETSVAVDETSAALAVIPDGSSAIVKKKTKSDDNKRMYERSRNFANRLGEMVGVQTAICF